MVGFLNHRLELVSSAAGVCCGLDVIVVVIIVIALRHYPSHGNRCATRLRLPQKMNRLQSRVLIGVRAEVDEILLQRKLVLQRLVQTAKAEPLMRRLDEIAILREPLRHLRGRRRRRRGHCQSRCGVL